MRAAASIRCSQLSSSTRTCLPLSAAATLSTETVPLTGVRPSAAPTVIGMSCGSVSGPSSASPTPSGNVGSS